jgi:hypothetical protein
VFDVHGAVLGASQSGNVSWLLRALFHAIPMASKGGP